MDMFTIKNRDGGSFKLSSIIYYRLKNLGIIKKEDGEDVVDWIAVIDLARKKDE